MTFVFCLRKWAIFVCKKSWISHSRCEWVTWSEINRANKKRPAAAGTSSTTTTRDAILSRRPAKLSSARVDAVQLRTLWTVSRGEPFSEPSWAWVAYVRSLFCTGALALFSSVCWSSWSDCGWICSGCFFPLRRQKISKKRVKSEHLCVRVSKKKSYGRRVSHFKSVRRVRKVKFAKIYY